jgi:hypothetical protein
MPTQCVLHSDLTRYNYGFNLARKKSGRYVNKLFEVITLVVRMDITNLIFNKNPSTGFNS